MAEFTQNKVDIPDETTHPPRHRGAHPEDNRLFSESKIPALLSAVYDLSWLLSRDYAVTSALRVVGDRYTLHERQRKAVLRASCSDSERSQRYTTRISPNEVEDQSLAIDGFNLLITIEAALSGGILIIGSDGCMRDIASVHGSYHTVYETDSSLELIHNVLTELKPEEIIWYLDQPVSNSGRLAQRMRDFAEEHGTKWQVETVMSPDHMLVESKASVAVTTDAAIINKCNRWIDIAALVIRQYVTSPWIIDLSR